MAKVEELYVRDKCGYCEIVKEVIADLGISIKFCNISNSNKYREQLEANCGRATVPVLHYSSADGKDCWLSESDAIIRYLLQTYD